MEQIGIPADDAARKDRAWARRGPSFRAHAHAIYDLEVDTSRSGPEDCARQIKQHLEDGPRPQAFKRLRERWAG